ARSIYDYSGSNECLGLGRRWLDDCVENHGGCKPYGPSLAQLPTRVIDVKSENPKVVDGKGISEQYAALSYCWGGNTDFKMTQDTQAMLRKGVPLADFPATLRDSIIVTRKLDISYLWIDALCIVQDSTEDWAYEAARMRNVYKGAIVTIAAAAAPKSTAGFFQHRQQSPMTCSLEWRNGDPTPPTVFLRPGSEIWDETMRSSILNTRGWTLQETLLAPRTLWFGSQQISFECSNGTVDEAGRTTEVIEEYRSKKFIRDISMEATTHQTPGGMTMTYFDFWNEIVRRYTSRSLTNPTDVLPALSGLADEFQRATGDEYIAGMWKTDMVRSLAWSRHTLAKNAKEGGQNNVYLAPSWSWASVAG
ncbi:heterokaryon incompatibility protein-domain-containing protein, partial [Massariosphaeria phaeospora]